MSATLLLVLGGIIAVGFLGSLFFEKTRMPDIFLLIGIGLFIGPILEIVPPDGVRPFMPVFGTLALTIILFEGGLDLDLRHAIRQAGRALLLAVFSFSLALVLVYHAILVGLGPYGRVAWAMAAALACTSAPIVIPVMARLTPRSPLRPLVSMESALSDALAVMVVLALTGQGTAELSSTLLIGLIGRSVLIGAGASLAGGLLWLVLLTRLYRRPYFYLMTIGFVFLLMGTVEKLHGSGAVAALVFGVVLANGETLMALLRPRLRKGIETALGKGGLRLHPQISRSHAEVSFMIRAFFFVYLGIIFRWPGSDFRVWLTVGLVAVAILVGREIAVQLSGWVTRIPARDRQLISCMVPRGLATAVLAALLAGQSPEGGVAWETLAALIVLLSNLWMTLRLVKLRDLTAAGAEEAA